jgi:hypothetical protein
MSFLSKNKFGIHIAAEVVTVALLVLYVTKTNKQIDKRLSQLESRVSRLDNQKIQIVRSQPQPQPQARAKPIQPEPPIHNQDIYQVEEYDEEDMDTVIQSELNQLHLN